MKLTRKQKMAIAGIVAVVIIVWLLTRGKNGAVNRINNGGSLNMGGTPGLGNVFVGGLEIPGRSPFSVPDFGAGASARDWTMIGACCADCSGKTQLRQSYRAASPPISYVYNQGASGPTIHNYITQAPAQQSAPLVWTTGRR